MAFVPAVEYFKSLEGRKPAGRVYGDCTLCNKPITSAHKGPGEPLPVVNGKIAHPDCFTSWLSDELEDYPILPPRIRRRG